MTNKEKYNDELMKILIHLCVLITSSEADEYKVLKNDYLIVKVWKLIDETFKEIGKPIITANELLKSIKDDKRIWDLFKNGITCTLNQVDSDNGSQQAKRYKVSSFEDGAHLTAAIRPSFDSWREQFLNREEYVLYIIKLDKKHQKEPTGEINPVTGKKVYRDVPDKYEFWLNRFVIKNDIEEVEEDLQ